jgi:hypothetical protein
LAKALKASDRHNLDDVLVYDRILVHIADSRMTDLGGNAMKYKIMRITYEDVDLDPDELMTLTEAAKELGASLRTVKSNAEAGRMTLVLDNSKSYHGRKLVLKKEVEEWKKDHPT